MIICEEGVCRPESEATVVAAIAGIETFSSFFTPEREVKVVAPV